MVFFVAEKAYPATTEALVFKQKKSKRH